MNLKPRLKLAILVADSLEEDLAQQAGAEGVRNLAAAFARALKSKIDLVHVEGFPAPGARDLSVIFRKYRIAHMKTLRQHSQLRGAKIKPLFVYGDPLTKLLELCSKKNRYEFIALATHGRKGLVRMILGSVTEEVIRNSKIPVLVLGPMGKVPAPGADLPDRLKIVVGTDLSRSSMRAEKYAIQLAKRLSAEVVLLHCLYEGFHPILQTAFRASERPRELSSLYEKMLNEARTALEKKRKRYGALGVSVTVKLDDKNRVASEAILSDISNSGAHLVILGTHGRNLFSGAILGSSARRVILGSPVPVITVK